MSSRELKVAEEAARAGGRVVAQYFRDGVSMRSKETYNLVSDADVESEHAVVEVIRRYFPAHAVIGEESHEGRTDAEHVWIVDPLDGTNNFAHGSSHFAVSVAYYRSGEPQCGVVLNPVNDELYTAESGQGAFCNGERAKVGEQSQLDQVLVGVGFYYDRDKMMEATLAAMRDLFRRHIHGIRRFGTASIDLCYVGQGKFGAFFEYELSPWDFAAGRLFVQEAGGRVTTCTGGRLPLARTSILATNGRLHDAMLQVVGAHHPNRDG